jgi:hypothetical protein
MAEEIEKPWVVYGTLLGPFDIGRLVKELRGSPMIQFSEEPFYSPFLWNPKYIIQFNNSNEAVNYFWEHDSIGAVIDFSCKEKVLKRLIKNFPKAMKQEQVQSIHDLLVSYLNLQFAQTSPKCTEESEYSKTDIDILEYSF